jgi:hypothetical protein
MKQTKEYKMDLESCFVKKSPESERLIKDFTGELITIDGMI